MGLPYVRRGRQRDHRHQGDGEVRSDNQLSIFPNSIHTSTLKIDIVLLMIILLF